MEFNAIGTVRPTPSRHEKSLNVLTTKFMSLLQEAKDGELDLKVAADILAVKQRRRIYDITNVMEGVGLIEKKTKSVIRWRGDTHHSPNPEAVEQAKLLKSQISELDSQEQELDRQMALIEDSMEHFSNDLSASSYKFVTHEDICDAFSGDTVLAIKAPAGTQLMVSLPNMTSNGQKRYEVSLQSESASIHVMVINREPDGSAPVVFSVPPTDELCLTPQGTNPSASLHCSTLSSSLGLSYCSQDHPMDFTLSSSPPDLYQEYHSDPSLSLSQENVDGVGPAFQPVMDMSNLLKLSGAADHLKDDRDAAVDLIEELISASGADYSFNLDEHEGVCDLFDMQILNY